MPNSVYLHTYLTYLKLTKTVSRNLLMAESLRAQLEGSQPSSQISGRKQVKPQDVARLYDVVVQVSFHPSARWAQEDIIILFLRCRRPQSPPPVSAKYCSNMVQQIKFIVYTSIQPLRHFLCLRSPATGGIIYSRCPSVLPN